MKNAKVLLSAIAAVVTVSGAAAVQADRGSFVKTNSQMICECDPDTGNCSCADIGTTADGKHIL